MDHEIRRKLLLKLIHAPRLGFNELWNKEGESNLVAYHLRKMEEDGLVAKYTDGYGLTEQGKKESAFIEGDTGGKAELITPIVIIIVRRGDTILCQQRLKEPFHGYWGVISGKINFGWNPKECAIRDLEEESGLIASDATLCGIESTKAIEGDKLMHHFLFFTYEVTAFSGTLKERTHKAVNRFLTHAEIEALPHFPGDWTERYFASSGELEITEKTRIMRNGQILEQRTDKVEQYIRKKYVE